MAALALDDISWHRGEVTIHGKGKLPVLHEAGTALAEYLRARGPGPARCRAVFLTAHAPRQALSTDGVRMLMRHACDRAGVSRFGPRVLRHSLASGMLAAGVPLAGAGETLRHADPATTANRNGVTEHWRSRDIDEPTPSQIRQLVQHTRQNVRPAQELPRRAQRRRAPHRRLPASGTGA
ncbi:MAG TPA: tyrosine-type recombinase/integrase [Streptosporangiaceae bacterium]|nr:tyrosine-type recombinase/integrase [Streptosporangiaceae bacterium]